MAGSVLVGIKLRRMADSGKGCGFKFETRALVSMAATGSSVARSNVEALGAPRTWLLAVGWRRLGLIDVCELPATARQGTETVA